MDDTKLERLYLKAESQQKLEDKNRQEKLATITGRLWKLLLLCEREIIKPPTGFLFNNRCPICNSKFERRYPYGDWKYLVCNNCDYEWCEFSRSHD